VCEKERVCVSLCVCVVWLINDGLFDSIFGFGQKGF
jgi:hypothetical protein